jgi:hypothetical protein
MGSADAHGAVRVGNGVGSGVGGRGAAGGGKLKWPAGWAATWAVLSGLLAWGAAETDTGDTQNVIAVMSFVCFVFFCMALVHVVRALRRR